MSLSQSVSKSVMSSSQGCQRVVGVTESSMSLRQRCHYIKASLSQQFHKGRVVIEVGVSLTQVVNEARVSPCQKIFNSVHLINLLI
jgi:hypothetical protein